MSWAESPKIDEYVVMKKVREEYVGTVNSAGCGVAAWMAICKINDAVYNSA